MEFLKEIYRVLKFSGALILTFIDKMTLEQTDFAQFGFHHFSTDEIELMVANAGFSKAIKQTRTEKITSKSGKLINRNYIILHITK